MNTNCYDPVKRLVQLGLPALARAVADNNEVTITTKEGAVYSVFKAGACINVTGDGRVLLGEPAGRQVVFDAHEIKVSFGVSKLPTLRESPGKGGGKTSEHL
jgi:hypothetical protein